MPNDPLTELLDPQTPRKRVHSVASRAGISPDVADDYLKVTNVESGHNVNVRDSSKGAQGFGQVMPDVKGGSTRTVGGRRYDLRDPDQNIEAGLRYFAEGGGDPVARRLHYFGGPRARQTYERTGRIPNISDGNMTAAQYVQATGGRKQERDPLSALLDSEQTQPPTPRTDAVTPKPRRGQQSAPTVEAALQSLMRSTNQATAKLKRQTERPATGSSGIGELRRIDDPEVQRMTRNQQQVREDVIKERRGRVGAYGAPSPAGMLHLVGNPVESLTGLFRSEDENVNREVQDRLKQQQIAAEPEVTEIRKEYGQMPAAVRSVAAPVLGRGGGGLLKTAGGIASLFGIAPNELSEWINKRGEIVETGSALSPLREKNSLSSLITGDKELEEVERGVPEKIATGVADLGVGLGRILLLKKATGLSFPTLMALEGVAVNSDKPLDTRIGKAIEGYALGSALDAHVGRGTNAALFGIPTAAQTGYEVSQGRMSPLDAAIQTGIQAGAGAVLTGRKEPSALERGLERQPARERVESDARIAAQLRGDLPQVSARERMAQRAPTTTISEVAKVERGAEGRVLREDASRVWGEPTREQYLDAERLANERANTAIVRSGRAPVGEKIDEPQIQTKPPVEAQRAEIEPTKGPLSDEIQSRNAEVGGRTGEEVSTEAPQRFYHRDFGEVIKTESQEGARAGRTRVQEANDPEKIHYVKTAQLTGAGNQRMVPVKSEPEPVKPVGQGVEVPAGETFTAYRAGSVSERGSGVGFHFGDKEHAALFGDAKPYNITLQNPYRGDILETDQLFKLSPQERAQWIKEKRSEGFDGAIFEGSNGNEYVAFSPSQIKSVEVPTKPSEQTVPVSEAPKPTGRSRAERTAYGQSTKSSLSQFIRRSGGITPDEMYRGELDRLRSKELGGAGAFLVGSRRQGAIKQSADIVMQMANDAGYRDPQTGRPFENPGDFLRAVEGDASGTQKIYARSGAEDFSTAEAEYYKNQQAARDAEDARTEFLEGGRGAELFDKILDRKATDADHQELIRLAEERGIYRAEVEDLIATAREEAGELEAHGSSRPTAPAEQLGFVQEGLTQESAPPPRLHDQRARLLREEQDRQAALNPERTAAQAKLEEIRRRGMTVEDYARQPDLGGKVPDPKEIQLLRELESGSEPEPLRQRRLGEAGILNVSPEKAEYKPATTPVLKDVERATMGQRDRASLRSVGRRAISEVQRRLIAEFTPLRELEANLYGKENVPVVNMARKFEQVAGAPAKAQADIFDFKTNVINPIKRSADDFNSYLFLKRVEDRLLNDPERKRVADWTVEKAQAGLSELKAKVGADTYQQLERAGDAYQKEMDKALRLQVESGRMSEDLYKAIKDSSDFYAPFKVLRYVEDSDFMRGSGRRVATTQELSKKITGIDSEDFQLGNILQASAEQIVRSRILAEKNLKMLELDKLADIDSKGDLIRRVEGDERPRQGYEYVRFLKDGESVALEVKHDVADAVQGLNPKQAGLLTQAMMLARKPLQIGATSANAGFQAVNLLFADLPRSALVSRYGLRNPKDIVQFPLDWAQSLFSSMKGNYGKPNKLYMEFLRSGAANSTIQRSLTPEAFRPTLGIAKPGVRHLASSVIDSVAKFSNAIEETSKVLGIKRGMRVEQIEKLPPAERQAAMEKIATEVRNYSGSPDFARKGADTRDLNLLFMFFNARLQGISADLSRLAGKTGTKEAAAAWARLGIGIGIPTTLLALVNHQPGYKDDYDKIPDWEKKNYWMIPRESYFTTEDGEKIRDYWRIPKRELGQIFGNTIEAAVDFGMKRDPKAAKDWSVDMLENLSPINVQGRTAGERLESAFASTNPALKLPAEALMNRDTFRHRDIVPEYMKGAEPSEQYRVTTPRAYVKAGQLSGLSPLQLEHAAEGLTGSALGQFSIRPPLPGRSPASQYPVLRRFFRSGAIAEDTGTQERVSAFEREETTAQVKRRREAIETLQSWRGLTDQEIASRLKELKGKDPKLAEKVEDMRDEVKKGITFLDKKIKMLGVESGAREAFIEGELASKPPEERAAYLDELKRKGLLPKRMRSRQDRPARAPREARQ